MPAKKNQIGNANEEAILDDARQVYARAREHKAEFATADRQRKNKLLPLPFMKGFPASLRRVTTIVGASASAEDTVRNATSHEETCRLALHDALVAVRDEIAATHPEDVELQRAFGRGKSLSKLSTPNLRAAATRVQQNYEKNKKFRSAAHAGGLRAPRFAQIIALRRGLTQANSAQQSAVRNRSSVNTTKKLLLRALAKDASRIRKAAAIVFRGQADILALYKTTIPRRPKKKADPVKKPSEAEKSGGTGGSASDAGTPLVDAGASPES